MSYFFTSRSAKAVLGVLVCTLGGCDTSRSIAILERNRLEAENLALQQTLAFLQSSPLPRSDSHIELFIGSTAFNKVLSRFDGYKFAINTLPDVQIQVRSIRSRFQYGLPEIDLQIIASHTRWKIEVELRARANFDISFDRNVNEAKIKLYVAEIKPELRTWGIDVPLGIFVAQLLRVNAQEYVEKLPEIRVPLFIPLDMNLGSAPTIVRIPIEQGSIDGWLSTPQLRKKYQVRIIKWLVLPDGIHVYGQIGA
ncbi:hypothetical protein DC522_03150 [Microvirga sp. KLBC 81]|nr:hypothetical protein DC522_03150 [Microvirga sp. KLBC 81]